jgi:hypothetical protein
MIKLEDKLYTSTEVADILGVSLRSVYRYIEENKLVPEVKTATGRHRFTKQNIVDFLYPSGSKKDTEERAIAAEDKEITPPQRVSEKPATSKFTENAPIVEKEEVEEEKPLKKQAKEIEPEEEPEVKEEAVDEPKQEAPVDWLAKFREAAKKFDADSITKGDSAQTSSISGISEVEKEEIVSKPKTSKFYYRSKLGGLKDIAQNIDKSSKNSGVDYAFTLNAGLSLHSPIKPFSLLHAYIRSKDRDFFERILMLTPAEEENSQLCFVVSDDERLYNTSMQIHGLTVVSKEKLLFDIRETDSDGSLLKDARTILG